MRIGNLRSKMVAARRKLPLPRTWHVRLELRYLDRIFQYHIDKAGTWDEKQAVYGELEFEKAPLIEKLEIIKSRRLRRKAHRLHVDMNLENSVDSKTGQYTAETYLTPAGYSKVRTAIREERKARNVAWGERRAWLTLLFALLGAVAGVFGAWAKLGESFGLK